MNTHPELSTDLRTLHGPDLFGFLRAALLDWFLIGGAFAAIAQFGPWAWVPAVCVIGMRQHALALLAHDAAHRLAARSRRWNDALGNLLCVWPLLMSLPAYRAFHFQHHRHLGTAADPERVFDRWPGYRKPASTRGMVAVFLQDMVGLRLLDLLRVAKVMGPRTAAERMPPVLFALIVVAGLTLAGLLWTLPFWFAALLLPGHACFRLRAILEHPPEGGTYRFAAGWLARAALFPHNTWCHDEHHRMPGIPARHLPKVRTAAALPNWAEVFAAEVSASTR